MLEAILYIGAAIVGLAIFVAIVASIPNKEA